MDTYQDKNGNRTGYKTREDIEKNQEKCLYDLLNYVWDHSSFYRSFYSDHGIRRSDINDLNVEDLPIIDKKILMSNFDDAVTDNRLHKREIEKWLALNRDPYTKLFEDLMVIHSSGSSGSPSVYVYNLMDLEIMNSIMSTHVDPEIRESQKTRVALFMDSTGHFGGITSGIQLPKTMYDILVLSLYETPEQLIKKLTLFQPHRITGYSSSVTMLAEWAIAGKLNIRPTSVFVGGDKNTAQMNKKIYNAWGIYAHDVYAASESLFIAVKKPEYKEMLIVEEINILEILDSRNNAVSPGKTGKVYITNLMNYTLPIIRYKLGDFALKGSGIPGFPHATIKDIQGRIYDFLPVLLDNGKQDSIHPLGLSNFYTEGLELVQFISKNPSEILIKYVSRHSIDREVQNEFQSLLDSIYASNVRVEVRRVPAIANDPITGKFRLVVVDGTHVSNNRPVSIDHFSPDNLLSNFKPSKEFVPFHEKELNSTISACFEKIVALYPDSDAVQHGDDVLSYDEINRKANRLASKILSISGTDQETVSLLLRHDISMIIGILAVLKAGKIYMPLDASFPKSRLQYFMEDSKSSILISSGRDLHIANDLAETSSIIDIETLESHFPEENINLEISSESLACILYTSGTTGKPKGVAHSHQDILHRVLTYTNDTYIDKTDRIALLHSFAFSASQRNIFGALLNGACICLFDLKENGVQPLIPWLKEKNITIYYSVPTAYRHLISFLNDKTSFPSLRLIRLGGEPATAKDALMYQKYFPDNCFFVNALAANETGTISQYLVDKETPIIGELIPVGFPVRDKEVRLLGQDGTEVKTENIGEIIVTSRYIAQGYWRKPSLTSSVFTVDARNEKISYHTGDLGRFRSNGCLEFVGRKDDQIQIRGHRVETAEVESILRQNENVIEAAVSGKTDKRGDLHLVAYIEPAPGRTISNKKMREFLSTTLPAYMIPTYFVTMEVLPRTNTGKVDKKSLPKPLFDRPELEEAFALPRNRIEEELVNIWKDLLGLSNVGIHDKFLDLGGHSLKASMLLSRISGSFGVSISMRSLFERSTIAEIGELIATYQNGGKGENIEEILSAIEDISDGDAKDLLEKP